MFKKYIDQYGNTHFEHEQCNAILQKGDDVIHIPFLLGYHKGQIPIKNCVHAKELISWLSKETGINRFIIIDVLDPEEYATKFHGKIIPVSTPQYKIPDLRVYFTWEPEKYQHHK